MAWLEEVVLCRRHPKENPQPGVCPSCLRERLLRIAGNNSRINNTNHSSSLSMSASPVYLYYYSSASSSGGFSPENGSRRRRRLRVASDVIDSIYFAISSGGGLKKSRSMANYAQRNGEIRDHLHHHHRGVNRKKKGGFGISCSFDTVARKQSSDYGFFLGNDK